MSRLKLPQVTLCAVSSVNIQATIFALQQCLSQADFARCLLLTDVEVDLQDGRIERIAIDRISSAADYSDFMLRKAGSYIETSHCLIVQWDGFLIDAFKWQPEFLNYDYVGASWPQFSDGYDVGNGGFSLRSRRLMHACASAPFQFFHPEDVAIGRLNRAKLEAGGMRFAPRQLADEFSTERAGDISKSFGFHGIFNMQKAIGDDAYWKLWQGLDDRSSASRDGVRIWKQSNARNKAKATKWLATRLLNQWTARQLLG
jgi:hypothetical protein